MITFAINYGGLKGGQRLPEDRIKRLLRATQRLSHVEGRQEISIAFVTAHAMKRLNEAYYGGHGVTDVLAFPSEGIEEARGYLGEILIYYPRAEKQAKEHGTTARAEVELLLVHGLLHLLGYNHETVQKKDVMFRLQDRILAASH
ncbi:rRNA maturation RNase YbeY [Candidatus Uhrbacteria bacterium CG10_big_fil_rev_8_21_14_0_10_50_16]|uniref:Endoribonuclease YbeY n=1 Tax=Candidatus Uhrbacteria bacterium CG10_big_fil_rev_8_21_14_0_10_50_16 TaxID=1975039 RepID=A0A2H0RM81_9BACT|nr:MAG: rRNA maturation RNase YbeY [Candidatus Uhrbacteria bacterium CG10_big_fil_rev_8_21_14_0_10_50_16]